MLLPKPPTLLTIRHPVGAAVLVAQGVSIPLAYALGEVNDIVAAVAIPFYGLFLGLQHLLRF